jgi:hypothetical protein
LNKLVAKELELVGTFLSHEEFRWAVDALVRRRIDISPMLSGEFSLPDAVSAFELAADRSKAMKVSLVASASFYRVDQLAVPPRPFSSGASLSAVQKSGARPDQSWSDAGASLSDQRRRFRNARISAGATCFRGLPSSAPGR